MIILTDIDTHPVAAECRHAMMCKAYNEWAYEHHFHMDPERLYFAAELLTQDPKSRLSRKFAASRTGGCRVGLVRPIDAMGNYLIQPKYDRVWRAMEDDRRRLRDASVSRLRIAQAAGIHGAALWALATNLADRDDVGLAAFVSDQCAGFPGGSVAMGRDVS